MSDTRNRQSATLADRFLKDARETRRTVSLYLTSGFQLKGEIAEFDQEAILFNHKDVYQLVMRSAVTSMFPVPDHKQDRDEWWQSYAPAAARK